MRASCPGESVAGSGTRPSSAAARPSSSPVAPPPPPRAAQPSLPAATDDGFFGPRALVMLPAFRAVPRRRARQRPPRLVTLDALEPREELAAGAVQPHPHRRRPRAHQPRHLVARQTLQL